jgi:murein DD-endopeptidase MepM/ murein hydrolase activator NlpD
MGDWDQNAGLRGTLERLYHRLFPERQIHLRTQSRIRFFRIPQSLQATCAASLVVFSAWVGYTTYSYVQHDEIVVAKDSQIADARKAYDDLLSEVGAYQRRFAELTRELEDNHNLMLSLVERNATLQKNLTTVERRLRDTETDREAVASARENLRGKLSTLEQELHALSNNNYSLRDNLSTVETDLQTVLRERNSAQRVGRQLENRVGDLEGRLANLQEAQQIAVERMSEKTLDYIASLEKVIEITGIDPDSLLEASTGLVTAQAQGGPFIPVKPDQVGGKLMLKLTRLDDQLGQWELMKQVMQRLPLAAPLETYYVTSSFGKRRDPINKRWSAHYGTDFGGPIGTRIYAPAPGVVTKAGKKGRYGNFLEIDHGSGLVTRYGHLHRILVKKGDKVEFRQNVAQLGNTGRSTGPHLHYEVVFDGKPRDPMKFIKAGRYVFQDK